MADHGYKNVEMKLEGPFAYGYLSGEKGTHRLVGWVMVLLCVRVCACACDVIGSVSVIVSVIRTVFFFCA